MGQIGTDDMNDAAEMRSALSDIIGIDVRNTAPDTRLSSMGLDPLDVIEVTMELEARFGLHIPDKQLSEITTVGHLLAAGGCTHPSQGIGCSKTACHQCEYATERKAA